MAYNSCTQGAATLTSIDGRCDRSAGGIKRILITAKDNISGITLDQTTAEITAITLVAGTKFEQWRFRPNTSSFTSTFSGDQATGNQAVTTEVSLQFSKAEAQKRLAIQSAINAAAVVIIEDMYGQYIYLGYDREVYITAATMTSGTASADLNGFNLTFTDEAVEFPHFLSADVDVDTLLTGAQ